ncbi:MAG: hypothetical protein AVO35_12050 [Candidatus Aegiribacteria sp. MLS_C]|nr:MAG: hypothetical protein AVO35_12050 [Candidatus Aegiribacteria sp. MLS_C]
MVPPWYFPDAKFATINVPIDEMHDCVDVLRNEKPVYAHLNSDVPGYNGLCTGKERAGEEES